MRICKSTKTELTLYFSTHNPKGEVFKYAPENTGLRDETSRRLRNSVIYAIAIRVDNIKLKLLHNLNYQINFNFNIFPSI